MLSAQPVARAWDIELPHAPCPQESLDAHDVQHGVEGCPGEAAL